MFFQCWILTHFCRNNTLSTSYPFPNLSMFHVSYQSLYFQVASKKGFCIHILYRWEPRRFKFILINRFSKVDIVMCTQCVNYWQIHYNATNVSPVYYVFWNHIWFHENTDDFYNAALTLCIRLHKNDYFIVLLKYCLSVLDCALVRDYSFQSLASVKLSHFSFKKCHAVC